MVEKWKYIKYLLKHVQCSLFWDIRSFSGRSNSGIPRNLKVGHCLTEGKNISDNFDSTEVLDEDRGWQYRFLKRWKRVGKNWDEIDVSLRIQTCPKKGISPIILLWGWDCDHQSYSREVFGFLGYLMFLAGIQHGGLFHTVDGSEIRLTTWDV